MQSRRANSPSRGGASRSVTFSSDRAAGGGGGDNQGRPESPNGRARALAELRNGAKRASSPSRFGDRAKTEGGGGGGGGSVRRIDSRVSRSARATSPAHAVSPGRVTLPGRSRAGGGGLSARVSEMSSMRGDAPRGESPARASVRRAQEMASKRGSSPGRRSIVERSSSSGRGGVGSGSGMRARALSLLKQQQEGGDGPSRAMSPSRRTISPIRTMSPTRNSNGRMTRPISPGKTAKNPAELVAFLRNKRSNSAARSRTSPTQSSARSPVGSEYNRPSRFEQPALQAPGDRFDDWLDRLGGDGPGGGVGGGGGGGGGSVPNPNDPAHRRTSNISGASRFGPPDGNASQFGQQPDPNTQYSGGVGGGPARATSPSPSYQSGFGVTSPPASKAQSEMAGPYDPYNRQLAWGARPEPMASVFEAAALPAVAAVPPVAVGRISVSQGGGNRDFVAELLAPIRNVPGLPAATQPGEMGLPAEATAGAKKSYVERLLVQDTNASRQLEGLLQEYQYLQTQQPSYNQQQQQPQSYGGGGNGYSQTPPPQQQQPTHSYQQPSYYHHQQQQQQQSQPQSYSGYGNQQSAAGPRSHDRQRIAVVLEKMTFTRPDGSSKASFGLAVDLNQAHRCVEVTSVNPDGPAFRENVPVGAHLIAVNNVQVHDNMAEVTRAINAASQRAEFLFDV